MSVLVDTHVLIWSLIDPARLSDTATDVLSDMRRAKLVSSVSLWEISLKYALGKLDLTGTDPERLADEAWSAGFHKTALEPEIAATVLRLPQKSSHKDPFDRLLIWQCIRNGFEMLTADDRFGEYVEDGLVLAV